MRRCEDEKMRYRPPLLEEPCAQTLSGKSSSMSMKSPMLKPLTNNVASKVMQMVALMSSTVMTVALEASCEGRDGLWEIACSENSWLTSAAIEHGIPSRRINYANGYDIYQPDTWTRLQEERCLRRPCKLWFGWPCTKPTTTHLSAKKCWKL